MPEPGQEGHDFRVTLRDLYLQQQKTQTRLAEYEKGIGDMFADIRITLTRIQSHLDGLDQRNSASDELHSDYGRRIYDLERISDISGLRTIREYVDGIRRETDARIKELEDGRMSADAVSSFAKDAQDAKSQANRAFWGMIAAIAAVIGVAIALFTHITIH